MNMTVRPLNGFLRSPTATHYATLQTLPCAVFTDMVMTVITSAWDFFDPMTEMLNEEQQWAMGVVAHQIAVMFAQRYGTGVETEEIINALSMYEKLSMDTRRMRVQMFDDELLLALLHAPAGMQMGAPPKLTYAKVNAEFKARGINAELVKGKGYHYFAGSDVEFAHTSSVMVYALNDLSMNDWLREVLTIRRDSRQRQFH